MSRFLVGKKMVQPLQPVHIISRPRRLSSSGNKYRLMVTPLNASTAAKTRKRIASWCKMRCPCMKEKQANDESDRTVGISGSRASRALMLDRPEADTALWPAPHFWLWAKEAAGGAPEVHCPTSLCGCLAPSLSSRSRRTTRSTGDLVGHCPLSPLGSRTGGHPWHPWNLNLFSNLSAALEKASANRPTFGLERAGFDDTLAVFTPVVGLYRAFLHNVRPLSQSTAQKEEAGPGAGIHRIRTHGALVHWVKSPALPAHCASC